VTAFEEAAARVAAGADHHAEAGALVRAMTRAEKLGCLDGDTPFWAGMTDMVSGGYYRHPWPAAAVERLGVPGLQFSDGPRGVVVGVSTCFPVSMARGATFDPDLEERIGDAIGLELRAAGATFYGGVCVNLLRHPAWGRAQETYGEDPHHVGEMGAALVRGVQRHAMACVKHFALNSMENARFTVDVTADDRALHEVYLHHFRRIVAEGVASVMSAYNSVNGTWCGQNAELLTDVLRREWDFDGFVVSDFIFGLRDAVASVQAGLDVEMPFAQQRAQHLPEKLRSGDLDEAEVDAAASRVVATLLRFWPALDRPGPEASVAASAEHRALAREAARRSIVLLRNEGGLLPLDPSALKRVAVIGRLAAVPNLGDGGSSDVHPPEAVTLLAGMRAALPGAVVVHHDDDASLAEGSDLAIAVVGFTKDDEGEFIGAAGAIDLAALFPPADHPTLGVGASSRPRAPLTGEPDERPAGRQPTAMAPGGDRSNLRLRPEDEALLRSVASHNSRTVVVVMGGSAVVMPWCGDVPVVLLTWYPGMEGGHALADVLLGAAAPSGRLPFAVPVDEDDLVAFDKDARSVTYDLFHGQWKLDRDGRAAQFPFGFGLSTTSFEVRDARLDTGSMEVTVTVANVGPRRGAEVVQVYGGCPSSSVPRPHRRLVGFRRVELEAGRSCQATVPLHLDALAVRQEGRMVIEDGEVVFTVADHAADPGIELDACFAAGVLT
jgi:beta-glucosidase